MADRMLLKMIKQQLVKAFEIVFRIIMLPVIKIGTLYHQRFCRPQIMMGGSHKLKFVGGVMFSLHN
jgi:hypothetical protein